MAVIARTSVSAGNPQIASRDPSIVAKGVIKCWWMGEGVGLERRSKVREAWNGFSAAKAWMGNEHRFLPLAR